LCLSSVAPFLFSTADRQVPPASFVSLAPSMPLSPPTAPSHPRRPAWSLEMLDQGSNSPAINPPSLTTINPAQSSMALPINAGCYSLATASSTSPDPYKRTSATPLATPHLYTPLLCPHPHSSARASSSSPPPPSSNTNLHRAPVLVGYFIAVPDRL
jgi:hypothetical protein